MSNEGGECPPYPKLPSFLSQVLYSLQMLQAEEKSPSGVPLKTIARFMKGYYRLTGDVVSQVKTSVLEGERRGLIINNCGGYLAIGAIAKIQLCDNPNTRKQLLEDVLKVFINKSNVPARVRQSKPASGKPKPGGNSRDDIIKLLNTYFKNNKKPQSCNKRNVNANKKNKKCACQQRIISSKKKSQCRDGKISTSSSSTPNKSSCSNRKKCRKK